MLVPEQPQLLLRLLLVLVQLQRQQPLLVLVRTGWHLRTGWPVLLELVLPELVVPERAVVEVKSQAQCLPLTSVPGEEDEAAIFGVGGERKSVFF